MSQSQTVIEQILTKQYPHIPRLLFVIAGPSGVGKNTIIRKLLTKHPDKMARVRTYTTREPREGEGHDQYRFVSKAQFSELAHNGKLMEFDTSLAGHDVYNTGDWYSMPKDIYDGIPPEKYIVIAEVDTVGAALLRGAYPDCVTIFIAAPPDILVDRIVNRPDEHMTSNDLQQRLETARAQYEAAKDFDYILLNDKDGFSEEVVNLIDQIIHVKRMRVRKNADLEALYPPETFTIAIQD